MEQDKCERCCICGSELRKRGHDPYPVTSYGRCCDACNWGVVIPRRVELSKQEHGQETGKD